MRKKVVLGSQLSSSLSPLTTSTNVTDEFMQNVSIHGLKYIGNRERSVFERTCWFLFVTLGCVLSVQMCYHEWQKWDESPLLVTPDPTIATHDPLTFPAVTICSTNKVSKKKLSALLLEPKYRGVNESLVLQSLRFLIKMNWLAGDEEPFNQVRKLLEEQNLNVDDLVDMMRKVTPSCGDVIIDCLWKSDVVPCERLFVFRLTDDGICCSFNVDENDRYIFGRKKTNFTLDDTIYEYGVNTALRLVLNPNINDTGLTISKFDGFKVLLHKENEFPDIAKRGFVVGPGMENYVSVNSISVHYTDAISRVSFDKRNCYVRKERSLKYHAQYSRSSCLFECRTLRIIEECGCLPHYMTADPAVPSCRLETFPCAAQVVVGVRGINNRSVPCNCPATCMDQWYTTELSSVALSPRALQDTATYKRLMEKYNLSIDASLKLIGLKIYFKYNAGDSYKMDVLYSTQEFIASVGGLLGLGLGFSLISGIEVCYFLCYRCLFRRRKVATIQWPGGMTGNLKAPYPPLEGFIQRKTVGLTPVKF